MRDYGYLWLWKWLNGGVIDPKLHHFDATPLHLIARLLFVIDDNLGQITILQPL